MISFSKTQGKKIKVSFGSQAEGVLTPPEMRQQGRHEDEREEKRLGT